MNSALFPLRYLLVAAALWLNRQQQQVIDYLKAENRLLKAKLGDPRIHFTDAERRRLAVASKALGRKALSELETLVTPDTLLRWHRQLVAQKWNFVHRRGVGRPKTRDAIVNLVLRMVRENPSWGYTRVMGALKNVGFKVGRGTIAHILREHGIDPAPLRGKRTTWSTFLKAHWKILFASDFFSVEVWRLHGLTTYYVLFVIELTTRKVVVAGMTTNPNEAWMQQIARNLVDGESGILRNSRLLLVDRDTKYCAAFRNLLKNTGTTTIRLPPRSPNLNAYAERFVGWIKAECLNRLIFIGEGSLRRAIREFVAHYHHERNHQGLGNGLIAENDSRYSFDAPIARHKRRGGMLKFYHRVAA